MTDFLEDTLLHTDIQPDIDQDAESELFEHRQVTADKGQSMMRLDLFLVNQLPNISRSRIKNAMEVGSITVNGKPAKLSYKIKPFDQVSLLLPYPPPPGLAPEYVPLDIRYEDDDVMVIHKQAGLVVHPGVGNHHGTLVHGLLYYFGEMPLPKGEPFRPGLVHRLDKDTTGIMVVAKREHAMGHLANQFFLRSTDRQYVAIVWGDVKEDEGTISGRIGRHPRDRQKFIVYTDDNPEGKHAVTHYKVLERFGIMTLVACKLETGRTHQIRVHMKHIGHTLFGDTFYGGDHVLIGSQTQKYTQFIRNGLEIMPRQALHAKTLAFDHPTTGERMSFDSEMPADFIALLEKLRRWRPAVAGEQG